jgi:hypothetical protein
VKRDRAGEIDVRRADNTIKPSTSEPLLVASPLPGASRTGANARRTEGVSATDAPGTAVIVALLR